jgi:hypothetical protein
MHRTKHKAHKHTRPPILRLCTYLGCDRVRSVHEPSTLANHIDPPRLVKILSNVHNTET